METLEEIDTPSGIKYDQSSFTIQPTCKLLILSVYNEAKDQSALVAILIYSLINKDKTVSHAFLKTDAYKLKPSRLLQSFSLSYLTELQQESYSSFVKVLICYNGNKV